MGMLSMLITFTKFGIVVHAQWSALSFANESSVPRLLRAAIARRQCILCPRRNRLSNFTGSERFGVRPHYG